MSGEGSITVHCPELCAELLGTPPASEGRERENSPRKSTRCGSPEQVRGISPQRVPSRCSTSQTTHIEDWLSRKARRAVVALPDDPELAEMKALCQRILEEERSFLADLDDYLSAEAEQGQCKKEMLYRKWNERVFQPLHTRLTSQMDSSGYTTLDRAKRSLFNQYLHYRNRKAVFLDTISSEEYDPLSLTNTRATMNVSVGPLDDPLISQATDYASEQQVVQGCDKGVPPCETPPSASLGREDTDAVLWLAMQLVHIDSGARTRSRQRTLGLQNESHLDPERWSKAEPTPALVKEELQLPHKTPIRQGREPFKLEWKET